MPRQVRDSALETRTARSRLKAQHAPYWRSVQSGLHLGYRKRSSGPGAWVRRSWTDGAYAVENLRTPDGKLVIADDYEDADGTSVLSPSSKAGGVRADGGAGQGAHRRRCAGRLFPNAAERWASGARDL
jgi:hypothetical protein